MAIITKANSKSAFWGVKPTTGDTYADARITKMEVGDEGSIEPLPNKEGETEGLCGYDRKRPVSLELLLGELKKFFTDDWFMLALVPFATASWKFEWARVKGGLEYSIDVTE